MTKTCQDGGFFRIQTDPRTCLAKQLILVQRIIGHTVAVVQKERHLFFALFAHFWHSFSPLLENEKRHGGFEFFRGVM